MSSAAEIQRLVVRLTGDNTSLRRALAQAESTVEDFESEVEDLRYDLDQMQGELNALLNPLKKNEKELTAAAAKTNLLSTGLKVLSSSLKMVKRVSRVVFSTMIGLMSKVGAALTALGTKMKMVGASMMGMGRKMKGMGMMMSTMVTAPIVAMGVASVHGFMKFETSLSKMVGLVGLSQNTVEGFKKSILEMSTRVAKGPKELADAMFFITSAGLRGKDALEALEMAAKGSASGLGETKVVADLLTSAMNAWGPATLNAESATNVLTATVREGKAEATELASSLGMVLPVASAMGVKFNEVGAAVAGMTRTGTQANTASMQLRQILFSILKPSKEAERELTKLGIGGGKLKQMIKDKGLLAVLTILKDKFADNDDAAAKVFGNIRALAGVLDLVGANGAENVKIFQRMKNTTGTLNTAFGAASQTAEFKWNKALSAVKVAMTDLGQVLAPWVEKLGLFLQDAIKWFNKLTPGSKKMAGAFALAAAAAGPVLMILGMVAVAAGGAITAMGGIVSVLGFLLSPAGLVMVAFDALKYYILTSTEAGRDAVDRFKASFQEFAESLQPAIQGIKDAFAAGDIPLAVDILWAQVQLSFLKGVQPLMEIWTGFTIMFKSAWVSTISSIRQIWLSMTTAIAKGIIHVAGFFGLLDAEEVLKTLEEDTGRQRKSLVDNEKRELEAIENAAGARMNAVNKNITQLTSKRDELLKQASDAAAMAAAKAAKEAADEASKEATVAEPPKIPDIDAKVRYKVVDIDAVEAGSAEAMSRIRQAMGRVGSVKGNATSATATATVKPPPLLARPAQTQADTDRSDAERVLLGLPPGALGRAASGAADVGSNRELDPEYRKSIRGAFGLREDMTPRQADQNAAGSGGKPSKSDDLLGSILTGINALVDQGEDANKPNEIRIPLAGL